MNEEKCGNCMFILESMGQCFCRRYPPTISMGLTNDILTGQMKQMINSFYPPTQKNHWCGEHKLEETIQ